MSSAYSHLGCKWWASYSVRKLGLGFSDLGRSKVQPVKSFFAHLLRPKRLFVSGLGSLTDELRLLHNSHALLYPNSQYHYAPLHLTAQLIMLCTAFERRNQISKKIGKDLNTQVKWSGVEDGEVKNGSNKS